MNIVSLERASLSFGTTTVLDEVSLGVSQGQRIGVVGVNGGGKSTLLAVLAGRVAPESGRVTHRGGVRIGVLDQAVDFASTTTVRDAVLPPSAFVAEHEWAGDSAVRQVLDGLGLGGIGLDSTLGERSGGERRRVALAAELVHPTDVLMLDEPTNHLDVEGVAWLAAYLGERAGALLVVTHDRWFLDAVCTATWEVGGGSVHSYDGGYAAYVLARAERERVAATTQARRQNLLRKELAWLRRGPPARTSKPKFRIEAAHALIADVPPARDRAGLERFAAHRLGRTVYELDDVTLRLGSRTLLDGVSWQLGPGDRIGVVGANGSGKTSLLRLLTRSLPPDRGRVVVGQTVRAAYLSQEVTELPGELRVLEAVQEIAQSMRIGDGEIGASQLLERFGFAAARQWTPVADLSGGERRRLQLMRLLMGEPNVLLLDEPTNDLDIDTLTALEDLLDTWPGSLVVVSHDRYLIERVTDSVVALLDDGRLSALPGGVEEYLARRAGTTPSPGGTPPPSGRTPNVSTAADVRAARKEVTRLERRLSRLETDEKRLLAALAEHATDYEQVSALDTELREVRGQRAEIEDAWLHAAEDADASG
ncbi:MAG: ABC-F family ATP-binding cassette domain-containing protein [Actinomycetota bacterium]|nr:ABC-F family ATP-binding cassette domain-containing protein [Actinomycetota bacterium]